MKTAIRLAIEGGEPVRQGRLPYGQHRVEEEDVQAVVSVLRSDYLTTGPVLAAFEEAFAKRVGASEAVAFSSGTAALHGAIFAADLKMGDEAVTTPLTFCATANVLLYQGATPRFADVSEDTLALDPEHVARCLTPKTKAVLPVDYAGHPAALDEILALAKRHGLVVIEDACHALGAEYKGKRIGSIAHMTVFSFHPVKHITTGEGGMVTTDNPTFARRLKAFRNHGIESDPHERQKNGQWHYEMKALGYNYRLSDIGSALGLSQLKRLDENLSRRRQIAFSYSKNFQSLPGVILPEIHPDVLPAWHIYPVRFDLAKFSVGREQIFRALHAEGIGVNVHYIPVYFHPYYRERFGFERGLCPIAEEAYERLVTLPLFHGMTDRDLQDALEAVTKVVEAYAR